jgi:outer membrane lipoprotein
MIFQYEIAALSGETMRLYLIFFYLLLSACATLSPAFKDAQVTDISYRQLSADIDSYRNTSVRWGGVIIDVENEENFSLMQVLFYPLDYYGRPELDKFSDGRFVIKSAKFLDPKVYTADREIIAVGVIDGEIERAIDNKRHQMPLITSDTIHLWPINFRGDYYGNCRSCYFRQLFW